LKVMAVSAIYTLASLTLDKLGLYFPVAVAISANVALLSTYWIPPRGQVRFATFVGVVQLIASAAAIGFWVPALLRPFMPIQVACALPAFVLALALYCPIRIISPRRSVSFAKWSLGCVALALAIAAGATIFSILPPRSKVAQTVSLRSLVQR